MITEFFKQFHSSGDADELVQFEVSTSTIGNRDSAKISICDGGDNTIRLTLADFERLQKFYKAYQDACDLIEILTDKKK